MFFGCKKAVFCYIIIMEILEAFMANPIFPVVMGIGLPVVILPIIMRFIVSTIIVSYSSKKYISGIVDSMKEGYSSEQDVKAVHEVICFARKRLARFFAFRSNLLADMKILLVAVKNVYDEKSDRDRLTFPFSVNRLVECLLLAFTELYTEYGNAFWYRLIRNTRAVWFSRITRVKYLWDSIFTIGFLEKLRSSRVLFRIVRALLVPVIGLPFFAWYTIKAVFTSVFLEGAFRFFYAFVIMKAGYYAIHVFGRSNPVIEKRIREMHGKKLDAAYETLDCALDPRNWHGWSNRLPEAADRYAELLSGLGVPEDRIFESETESVFGRIGRYAKRFAGSIKRAYVKKNPFGKEPVSMIAEIKSLASGISSVYRPGVKNPFLHLRVKEIVSAGYFASLLVFYRMRKTPLVSSLLDKISMELVVNVSSFLRNESVKKNVKTAKKAYDAYQLASAGYKAYKLIRGFSGPVGLVWSAASPIVYQQVIDLVREYVFHTAGRLAILVWEADRGKRDLLESGVILGEAVTTKARTITKKRKERKTKKRRQ